MPARIPFSVRVLLPFKQDGVVVSRIPWGMASASHAMTLGSLGFGGAYAFGYVSLRHVPAGVAVDSAA